MKDHLARLVSESVVPTNPRNIVREYLQARILGSLQRSGAMIGLAFHGGTALRFLYSMTRYSEDLDFALERDRERYDLHSFLRSIAAEMAAEAYEVSFKVSEAKPVHSAFVRFPGLLFELGLSSHSGEAMGIKLEVDTNPPAGATLETTVVRRHVVLQLQHHDRATLLSGKLNSVLTRPYLKGRDLYDLLWYLADPAWPAPNLVHLNNALRQAGWAGNEVTVDNWRGAVRTRLARISWREAANDVRAFLERDADVGLLTQENALRLLGS